MPTQEVLTDLFRTLAGEGEALLMTTHDLVAARSECDRLVLVNRTVIASGTPAALSDPDPWIRTFQVRPGNPLLAALGLGRQTRGQAAAAPDPATDVAPEPATSPTPALTS